MKKNYKNYIIFYLFFFEKIRIHNCKNVVFYLFATSKSIIENCTNLKIKKYNHSYQNFEDDFEVFLKN